MFGIPNPLDANAKAQAARRALLVETGQMGHPVEAPCAMAPATDKVVVQRLGPVDHEATLVGITAQTAHGALPVNLYPRDARRIAIALLDAADEADGIQRLGFQVPATCATATRLLAEGRES